LAEIGAHGNVAGPDTSLHEQPARAILAAAQRAGLSLADIDLFEINEAFAAVSIISSRILAAEGAKADIEHVNVNGGAVSLGHPLGCSGARIIVTLLNVLEQNNGKIGAAAICNGGGGASAIVIERH
jgi:acetyl-CoA C-acetyltransferase